jgi:hypothetical protein
MQGGVSLKTERAFSFQNRGNWKGKGRRREGKGRRNFPGFGQKALKRLMISEFDFTKSLLRQDIRKKCDDRAQPADLSRRVGP